MRDFKTFIARFLGAGCLFFGMAGVLLAADERKAQTQAAVKIREVNVGTLCDLDPALLVTPPQGKEAGYVPIATRQERGGPANPPGGH